MAHGYSSCPCIILCPASCLGIVHGRARPRASCHASFMEELHARALFMAKRHGCKSSLSSFIAVHHARASYRAWFTAMHRAHASFTAEHRAHASFMAVLVLMHRAMHRSWPRVVPIHRAYASFMVGRRGRDRLWFGS
ncbi:hypothetical protein NL676_029943 [Syzygium grande]|nr:hypothetical protein NL676_029943 [Syzygium grande]